MKSILESPEYRIRIGEKLKESRKDNNFSISDVAEMIGTSDKTIRNTENGITTNIDYYVEFAKAVNYPLATLLDFQICLKPRYPLSPKRAEAVKLTSKIRKYIINTEFLDNGKNVSEIRDKLISLKQVTKSVSSTNIAGVMRNLVQDELIKVSTKDGRKNVYVRTK